MLHDAGNISYSKSLIINLNTFFYIITIINKTVQYIRVIIHHFISVPKETKFIYYYYFFAQKNCKPCFQSLQPSLFMYLQNHIQSFISPSISFLSYHFKLTFRGNHSRTSFSHSLIVHLVTNGHAFLQDPLRMQASFPSLPLMLFRFLPVCSGYALDRLVTVSSMHYCTSTSALSTSSSSRGLTTFVGISHLKGGFTLRCLQRLSLPDLATLPCLWQDNRYTSGRSSPVLSY